MTVAPRQSSIHPRVGGREAKPSGESADETSQTDSFQRRRSLPDVPFFRAHRGTDAAEYLDALHRYLDFRLERGRRFMWMLSTQDLATPIRYVQSGDNCALTPARLLLRGSRAKPWIQERLSSTKVFLPVSYSLFLCERHDQPTSNVSFIQDNLLNVLLSRELPWKREMMPP
jgi:hypothetical protein